MWDWMIYQDITIGSMSHTWGGLRMSKTCSYILYRRNINNGST